MTTAHYNFPTIIGTDTIDGVNAINGLANAVDSALFGVAGSIPQEYTLPIAGTTSLGGVRGAGQISVNPTTGDMTINPGTISGNMIQTGTIVGSNLANGTVGASNLDASTQANINQGIQAFSTQQLLGERSSITNWQDANGFTATQHSGFYVVYPSAKLIVAKINVQGNINLSQNTNGVICTATLPNQYSLPYTFQSLCSVGLNPTDNLPINYEIYFNDNKVTINVINFGARSGVASGISVTGTLIVPYQPLSS